jgi:hypothetical protein
LRSETFGSFADLTQELCGRPTFSYLSERADRDEGEGVDLHVEDHSATFGGERELFGLS